jgi:hypothetical protein
MPAWTPDFDSHDIHNTHDIHYGNHLIDKSHLNSTATTNSNNNSIIKDSISSSSNTTISNSLSSATSYDSTILFNNDGSYNDNSIYPLKAVIDIPNHLDYNNINANSNVSNNNYLDNNNNNNHINNDNIHNNNNNYNTYNNINNNVVSPSSSCVSPTLTHSNNSQYDINQMSNYSNLSNYHLESQNQSLYQALNNQINQDNSLSIPKLEMLNNSNNNNIINNTDNNITNIAANTNATPKIKKKTTKSGRVKKPMTLVQRKAHNKIERKYRININSKIANLQKLVPWMSADSVAFEIDKHSNNDNKIKDEDDNNNELDNLNNTSNKKLNKSMILDMVTEYILLLKDENRKKDLEILKLKGQLNDNDNTQFQQ